LAIKVSILYLKINKRKKDMSKKLCSIVWDGLKDGPRYKGKDVEELKTMTKEFLSKHGSMKDPEEFGQAMREFAEEKGYEVEDNVYLDTQLHESMTEAVEKKFIEALEAGKVKFSYYKVGKDPITGSRKKRDALGTRKPELMDIDGGKATSKKLKDGEKKHFVPPTVIVYWDLDVKGFRSFRKENFIKYEAVKEEDSGKED
jgi:hypothetical protein